MEDGVIFLIPLLQVNANGLFCERGDFYVDPWRAVKRALITHAHSDHARWGSENYLTSRQGEGLLRARLSAGASIESMEYGETRRIGGVSATFFPAGHVLGSAQIRLEFGGEVWVVSGDYKTTADKTCASFEPVRCHTFITESTFGLPIYRWAPQAEIFAEIDEWWRGNQLAGQASVLFAYSLGKAQRLIAGVDATIGPIYCHGAVEKLNEVYRENGIALPETVHGSPEAEWSRALIVAPPSVNGTPWMRKFGAVSTAFASGWMRLRGARRRESLDRGFVLSDHADWPGLLGAIDATGAERVLVTHGYRAQLVRWLTEQGRDAQSLETRFEGESAVEQEPAA
jgi:putative mRNA 3-end processing factor